MAGHALLLETFAEARRTWDDVIGLQTDVIAGSGNLKDADLVELQRRVEAHRVAIDMLVDALDTEPSEMSSPRNRS